MRRFLGKWMLAAALISLPLSASALEVRVDEDAEPTVLVYDGEGFSFEYEDGDVVSHQTIRGKNGAVGQTFVHFVDPEGGERKTDAFLSVQLYEKAPTVEGVDDESDAVAQNLIQALNQRLGKELQFQQMNVEFAKIGSVTGYQALLQDKENARYISFFVVPVDEGFALVLAQRDAEDEESTKSVEKILETLSFEGK